MLTRNPVVGDYVRHNLTGTFYKVVETNIVMKIGKDNMWTVGVAYLPAVEPQKLCVRDAAKFMTNFQFATEQEFENARNS